MKKILKIVWLLSILILSGCGGGSEGTGTNKSISGSLRLEDGTPLTEALVTVLETGDNALSDDQGRFLIETRLDSETINISVEKDDVIAQTELIGLDTTSSNIMVELTFRRGDASLVSVDYLEVWARIVGNCEKYFKNDRIIKQKAEVPEDLKCVLRFFVSGDGRKLERISGQIDVRSCNSDNWRKIASGSTGTGTSAGFGDIEFDYIDNRNNCVYRLLAPINDPNGRASEISIHTLTFQSKE